VEPDASKKQSYYDYAVNWGSSPAHPWTMTYTAAGVMTAVADNQACGQTTSSLQHRPPDIRIKEIKANIDDMIAKGNTDAWW